MTLVKGVPHIGKVVLYIEAGRETYSGKLKGSVRFGRGDKKQLVELDKELIVFEFKNGTLQVLLPKEWEKEGTQQSVTAVAANVGVEIIRFLVEQGYSLNPDSVKLKIGFSRLP